MILTLVLAADPKELKSVLKELVIGDYYSHWTFIPQTSAMFAFMGTNKN